MTHPEPGQLIFHENCKPRQVLELFAVKWISMVIYALAHGTSRPSELQRQLPGISKKMLTQTLRDLERDGLVKRKVYPVVPPMVEYSLTSLGEVFVEPIATLYDWGERHLDELEAIRANRDKGMQ
jgi:DNA-binding HxlR family transcriptional regulator